MRIYSFIRAPADKLILHNLNSIKMLNCGAELNMDAVAVIIVLIIAGDTLIGLLHQSNAKNTKLHYTD